MNVVVWALHIGNIAFLLESGCFFLRKMVNADTKYLEIIKLKCCTSN